MEAQLDSLPVRRRPLRARALRVVGTAAAVAGVALLAWALTVWLWQDPFTALYTRWEQHELAGALARRLADPANLPRLPRAAELPARAARGAPARAPARPSPASLVAAEERAVATAAARYRRTVRPGQPIGRIVVPRLGLDMILVEGTDTNSLEKGPGRDPRSYMPGQGQLVYIAGHRTTFLAPFSQIDTMRKGDPVTLELPYGTFVYRVTGYRIVPATDMSVLRSHGHGVVELQACNPRFFATQRYVVYALPVRVEPHGGLPYRPRGSVAR